MRNADLDPPAGKDGPAPLSPRGEGSRGNPPQGFRNNWRPARPPRSYRTPALDSFLGASPELAALAAHAARLGRYQEIYARAVPAHLAEASRVANYKLETLVVHAANAAVAAKLKQLAPRLRAEFVKAGIPVSDVQFKVQPIRPEEPVVKSDREAHVSDASKRLLANLGDTLAEDSPLRAALKRFVERSG